MALTMVLLGSSCPHTTEFHDSTATHLFRCPEQFSVRHTTCTPHQVSAVFLQWWCSHVLHLCPICVLDPWRLLLKTILPSLKKPSSTSRWFRSKGRHTHIAFTLSCSYLHFPLVYQLFTSLLNFLGFQHTNLLKLSLQNLLLRSLLLKLLEILSPWLDWSNRYLLITLHLRGLSYGICLYSPLRQFLFSISFWLFSL